MGQFQNHPLYELYSPEWVIVSDCYDGERAVKGKRQTYLPGTQGQIADGLNKATATESTAGQVRYENYVARASFPELVRTTTETLLGVLLREQWEVTLPESLAYLSTRASVSGESLNTFIARVLRRVLLKGRAGLLLEITEAGEFGLLDYAAEDAINWEPADGESGLAAVILDESGQVVTNPVTLARSQQERFRRLALVDGQYTSEVYKAGDQTPSETVVPSLQGKPFKKIPFVFAGSVDTLPPPDDIPMLALARLALTIYRTEADYRQALFSSGQDTLVITGVSRALAEQDGKQVTVGADAILFLPEVGQTAQYIGIRGDGLPELRAAIDADHKRAEQFGLALLTSGSQAEAARTLETRVASRTATLGTIAQAVGAAIKQLLDWAAEWAELDTDEVIVKPNMDFGSLQLNAAELNGIIAAKARGFQISWESISALAERGKITNLTFQEERDRIADEGDIDP